MASDVTSRFVARELEIVERVIRGTRRHEQNNRKNKRYSFDEYLRIKEARKGKERKAA